MNGCPDRDDLVTMTSILGDRTLPVLEHVAECGTCRGEVNHVLAVRRLLSSERPLPAGFVGEVTARIEAEAAREKVQGAPSTQTRPVPLVRLPQALTSVESAILTALFGLLVVAATLAVLTAATAGGLAGGETSLTGPRLLLAVLAGAGATLWASRRDHRGSAQAP
jgi:hypothetical protein